MTKEPTVRKHGKNHARNLQRKISRAKKKGLVRGEAREELRSIQTRRDKKKRAAQDAVDADYQDSKVARREAEEAEFDAAALLRDAAQRPTGKAKRRGKAEAVEEDADDSRAFRTEAVEYSAKPMKPMLPVKGSDGRLEQRFTEAADEMVAEEEEEAEEEEDEEEKEEEEPLEAAHSTKRQMVEIPADCPPSELAALRTSLLREHRGRLAAVCLRAVESPDPQPLRVRELVDAVKGQGVEWIVREKVALLAMGSLVTLLTDVLPGYRLRERSAEEKSGPLKKDTRAAIDVEESQLRSYKAFLKALEERVRALPRAGESTERLGVAALRSLATLLHHNTAFNYSHNIIKVLVHAAASPKASAESVAVAAGALKRLFAEDTRGEASIHAVRLLNALVKDSHWKVSPLALEALLALRIREVDKRDPAVTAKAAKEKERKRTHLQKVGKTDRKRAKQLKALEAELRETEATESRQSLLRLHTRLMDLVFTLYFRVLKRQGTSQLMTPVLAGVSKFAHLLSVQYVPELISTLQELSASGLLGTMESLDCAEAVFVILSGDGSAFALDPSGHYRLLYRLLPSIAALPDREKSREQMAKALSCLRMMLIDRRKKVSPERVAAFATRLSLLGLAAGDLALGLLLFLRQLFVAHPTLAVLVDDEEEGGSGRWRPDLPDPDHTHSLNATLEHLRLLSGEAGSVALNLLAGLPSTGPHKLPPALAQREPSSALTEAPASEPTEVISLTKKERLLEPDTLCKLLWSKAQALVAKK